jgi:RNA polymerase sigma factor (sigma-70 family)
MSLLETLLTASAAGDNQALQEFISATVSPLRAAVIAMSGRRDLVDDIINDTYADAVLGAGRFTAGREVLPWLKGIARHRLLRQLRHESRYSRSVDPRVVASWALLSAEVTFADDADDLLARLRACLEHLSPAARTVIDSFYAENRPIAEIALDQGRQPDAVAKVLSRARQALRLCLDRGADAS